MPSLGVMCDTCGGVDIDCEIWCGCVLFIVIVLVGDMVVISVIVVIVDMMCVCCVCVLVCGTYGEYTNDV